MYVRQKYNFYHRQANATHFQKLGFQNFACFYQQKVYKTEPPGYSLTKSGQKAQTKIIRN